MTAEEIVETIMTQHWDLAACQCWVCVHGRDAGLHPRRRYLPATGADSWAFVRVDYPPYP